MNRVNSARWKINTTGHVENSLSRWLSDKKVSSGQHSSFSIVYFGCLNFRLGYISEQEEKKISKREKVRFKRKINKQKQQKHKIELSEFNKKRRQDRLSNAK